MILDIGRRSIEHVCSVLARAKTLEPISKLRAGVDPL
jgi:hypothetical protein